MMVQGIMVGNINHYFVSPRCLSSIMDFLGSSVVYSSVTPFSCTTKYSSDGYSPRPPDIRVRLLPTKPPVHVTTEQPGRDIRYVCTRHHRAKMCIRDSY